MKKVLITGADGFIGKNLLACLRQQKGIAPIAYDLNNDADLLSEALMQADAVVHLAGVNRPKDESEYFKGNTGLTELITAMLIERRRSIPVIYPSSIQADLENAYGISKRDAEKALLSYSANSDAPVCIYRLPNVFGKWCRPNYNSVVATFCHNIARGLPIKVNDPQVVMSMVYIDDVVDEFMAALDGSAHRNGNFCQVEPVHTVTLGEIADRIRSFREHRRNLEIPDMANPFVKKLYATYLSYLPVDGFIYPLKMNIDERGSFTEFMRSFATGQVSVNISKPGITKGNHWHRTKNEKFLVLAGNGVIRLRNISNNERTEYRVSGERLEVVEIPAGYTHNITNTGATDMVTLMWANEPFDTEKADTYFENVDKT